MLEQAGFTIESENPELDYYGSLRTIFVAGEKRVLLEWDGEEGFGYAEVWKNGEWEQLPTNVRTSDVQQVLTQNENDCPSNIPRLESARVLKLVNAWDFQFDYWNELENNVRCLSAKSHIARINAMTEKFTGKPGKLCVNVR